MDVTKLKKENCMLSKTDIIGNEIIKTLLLVEKGL